MNISHKPMMVCFVFTLLSSSLAFARPMIGSEDGWRSREKETDACHISILKPRAATGRTQYRLPNALKDDWPAGMILGNADLVLALRRRLNA
jgi:hypothetical protein